MWVSSTEVSGRSTDSKAFYTYWSARTQHKAEKAPLLLTSETLKLTCKFFKRKVTGGFKRKQIQLRHFQHLKSLKEARCQALVAD